MSKEKIEKAKQIMEHWVEYEEKNKDKINKADELIGIQKTLLQYIEQLESIVQAQEMEHKYDVNMIDEVKGEAVKLYNKIDKLNKMIDAMASYISDLDVDEDICGRVKISPCADETSVPVNYCIECIKQYFEEKVEEK